MKKRVFILLCLLSLIASYSYAGLLGGASTKTITYYAHYCISNTGQMQPMNASVGANITFSGDTPTLYMSGNSYTKEFSYDYDESDGKLYYYIGNNKANRYRFTDDKSVMIIYSVPYMGFQTTIVHYTYPPNGGGVTVGGGSIGTYNSGGSSSSGSTYTTCRSCNGSGTCTSCNGRRGYYVDSGMYTGSSSRTWQNCPSCSGSGRCFNCHGTGRY